MSATTTSTARTTDRPAWAYPAMAALTVPIVVLITGILVLSAISHQYTRIFAVPLQGTFPLVGLVILRSRPRNTVGWSFLVGGVLLAFNGMGETGVQYGAEHHWSSAAIHIAGWSTAFAWFPGLFVLITVALLHFPDGAPVSPRWRWLSVAAVVVMATFSVCFSVAIWGASSAAIISDQEPHAGGWRGVVILVGIACLPAMVPILVGAVASLVVRYRRSSGTGRLQIRWVAAAGSLAVVVEVGMDLYGTYLGTVGDTVQTVLESSSFALIAIATGVAITRHRLYDIDRIVSRTVSYLVISAALVGVYAVVVAGAALVIPDRDGSAGVAVATLTAVALFVPLRARIQHAVDRRFDRARYDADRLAGEFATALRVDLTQAELTHALLRATRQAVAPSTATLWLAPPQLPAPPEITVKHSIPRDHGQT